MDRIKINQITMKSLNIFITLVAALAFTLIAAEQSQAQDEARSEVITLFNQAQEQASSGNFSDAIDLFEDALEIARENSIDDIAGQIEELLPRVAQSRASNAYRGYQNDRTKESATRAIQYFKDAKDIAERYNNSEVARQAQAAIPQLYYIRGVIEFRAEDYAASISDLETAMELNANYAVPYYQMGLVKKAQSPDDLDTMMEWLDKAIEVAERTNDTRTLNNARNAARDELIFRAANLADDRQFSRAVELLNRVERYDSQSASAQYRLAEIHNERGNWDQALQHATRALDYETGGVTDRAKIYFELGTAYKGKGEISNACNAFENARYGDFTDPANHELQFELKCEGHTPTGR
jgi:tetratricopeptide (TPR) repeat protein